MLNVAFECLYYKQKMIYFTDFVVLVPYTSIEFILSPNKHVHLMVLI